MKNKAILLSIFLLVSFLMKSFGISRATESLIDPFADSSYLSSKIFDTITYSLNKLIPEYKKITGTGFSLDKDSNCVGFFVQDLSDTTNKSFPNNMITFKNYHVYLFAPLKKRWSVCFIMVLNDGQVKIFNAINCFQKGNDINEVVNYIGNLRLSEIDKDMICKRLKNFEHYEILKQTDQYDVFNCDYYVPM